MAPHQGQASIVTVTLNPALDLTGQLAALQVGEVNKVNAAHLRPAGKGVNVAMVLADLGASVIATGLVGKESHAQFSALFAQYGITDAFVDIEGSCRINVKVAEDSGRISDINFPGSAIHPDDLVIFEKRLFMLAEQHTVFVFAGSLPEQLPPETLQRWLTHLSNQGKQVIFDSSGDAFAAGIRALPFLIKPNESELGEYLNAPIDTLAQAKRAAVELSQTGLSHVVVSMGEKGVLWQSAQQTLHATPPAVPIASTVGAGDTLVAGLTFGHLQDWEMEKTLQFATALSAMAVSQLGVGMKDDNTLDELIARTVVTSL
uniref:1-phosphofructokinase n=1 Tax=Thaumasiovibrio subtropicus TaxID=1891207 RepID=UPI000B352351|nr:1-phosphofructokinase [Thaumasiovibrio subtropicus]